MADNDQVLQELKAINKRLDEQGQVITQVKTGVEALAAGQREIRETMATKADVLNVGTKIDKMKKRIEGLEDHTDMPHPDKN
jgi:septal ring factor EnvC (AmiA/AmiB activator)